MAKKKIDVERLRGVVNMGREAEESMEESMIISVHVDPACPRWLALAVKTALVPERDAVVNVSSLVSNPTVADVDVNVIVAGHSEEEVRSAIRALAAKRQRVVVVAESSLDIPETNLPTKLSQFVFDVVASENGPFRERFSAALLDATDKDVSCAANFAFCREAATARLVSRVAARNVFMGLADFIPGAGMPLITMNQINMGFDIAASYGHGLTIGRVSEVIFIVAAGFAYRGIAKMLCQAIPPFGIVIRIGVAYGGTLVTGRTLATHFSQDLPPAQEEVASRPKIVSTPVVGEA
jgi:uncharacterized protein (DUF697 family)